MDMKKNCILQMSSVYLIIVVSITIISLKLNKNETNKNKQPNVCTKNYLEYSYKNPKEAENKSHFSLEKTENSRFLLYVEIVGEGILK